MYFWGQQGLSYQLDIYMEWCINQQRVIVTAKMIEDGVSGNARRELVLGFYVGSVLSPEQ